METIYNYIENMFKTLPNNSEMEHLKSEITANMKEKYNELKSEGKSENEAIGIVISEFGNIDEIIKEFGIEEEKQVKEGFKPLTLDEINRFHNLKKRSLFIVSIGVLLCLLGVSILISLTQMIENKAIFTLATDNVKDMVPVSILLIFIVFAVGLFIFAGAMMEKYKYIEKGEFSISNNTKIMVQNKIEEIKPKKTVGIIIGVSLCILSPIAIFLGGIIGGEHGETYGTSILLMIIALAVFLFINLGASDDAYKHILKEKDYSEEDKVTGTVSGIVWPIATCIFLIWGFVFNGWGICWIVFPITGILFRMFCTVYKSIK